MKDRLPAYITWEQWEHNQRRLRENSTSFSAGPPRGASLIAGRVSCGKCGARMAVSYKDGKTPYFTCSAARMNFGEPLCQSFEATSVESLVERLVLEALQPASVELSMQAVETIEADRARLEKQYCQTVNRASYETDLARRRYEEVDPSNRLVAAELERRWEATLHVQRQAEEALNRFRHEGSPTLSPVQRRLILDLANDFPSLWRSPSTSAIDRQRIVRCLVDDVVVEVLDRSERLAVAMRWCGGFQSRHEARRRVQSFCQLDAAKSLAQRIQQLYDEGYPLSEIARLLNAEGYHPAKGKRFTQTGMGALCRMLRREGVIAKSPRMVPNFWRAGALCRELGIKKPTISGWRKRGWIQVRQVGRRWIYWADSIELQRLKRLTANPPSGSKPTPPELATPASNMPVDSCEKS